MAFAMRMPLNREIIKKDSYKEEYIFIRSKKPTQNFGIRRIWRPFMSFRLVD